MIVNLDPWMIVSLISDSLILGGIAIYGWRKHFEQRRRLFEQRQRLNYAEGDTDFLLETLAEKRP